MAQIVEINDPAELAGCRLLWTKLQSETAGASFFHSLDWLETYWRHYGDRQRLRVLMVEAAGAPIGILPLVVRRETTRLGTIRVLTYPLADWGSFYGPIGPYPTATLIAGLGHIRRTEADWDLIDLRWIDGPRPATARCGRWRSVDYRRRRPFGPKAPRSNWKARGRPIWPAASAPGGKACAMPRSGWQRTVPWSSFASGHAVPLGAMATPAGRCTTSANRWRCGVGKEVRRRAPRYRTRRCNRFCAAHVAAAHAGAADISLLSVGGVAVAFAYCYQTAGYVYGLRMGFDADQAHEGAGTVLLARLIEDSFQRGDRIVDLGSEYLDCKRPWQTRLAEATT